MIKRLTILCDVDGVVADMLPEWLLMHNVRCVKCQHIYTKADITSWNLHNLFSCGTDIYQYLWHDDLYNAVKPFPGAIEGIRELRQMGHRVIFVTSGLQPAKIKWLYTQGLLDRELWRSDPDWIIANDKSLFKGDIMIDDYSKNLDSFSGFPILFDAPYNQEPTQYLRVMEWSVIVNFVSEIPK